MRRGWAVVTVGGALLIPSGWRPAEAQEAASSVQAAAAAQPIRLDGTPNETVWLTADSVTDFHQLDPREGEPATERTVIRFLRDDRTLYVGIWAYDRDPRSIRRAHFRRDGPLWEDDNILLLLDAAMDRRTGILLSVNANGALWDAEVAGTNDQNEFWDGVWDGRAAIHGDGWTAELAVPFQMLRAPGDANHLAFNVGRFIRRKNEWVLWRGWRRDQGILFLDAAGTLAGLAPLPPRGPLEVRPYVAATYKSGEAYQAPRPFVGTLGVDLKLAPAPTLTVDVTVNTDFAQADVDQLVVNLSRFPVFFPEQREFFLEAAPLFDFGAPGSVKVFHSRRIGLDSAGVPVPILAGARLTGRAGTQRLGLLVARTGDPDDAFDVVGRLRRDAFSRGSVGAIVTVRAGPRPNGTSGAAGLDFRFPLVARGRNVEPSGYVAMTFGGRGRAGAGAWRLGVEYPNDLARHAIAVGWVGDGFGPSLGFVRQAGVWELLGAARFYPRPARWGIRRLLITALEAEIRADRAWDVDNALVSVRPLGAEFESGDWVELYVRRYQDVPKGPFQPFPGVTLAPGSYIWYRAEVGFATDRARALSLGATASVGGFYAGTSRDLAYDQSLRLPPHVVMGLVGSIRWVRLPQGGFTAHMHGVRLDYATSPRLSTTAQVQWDNESRTLAVHARLHWIPRPGRDVYVVYGTAFPTPLDERIPGSASAQRSVIVKAVWYFRP